MKKLFGFLGALVLMFSLTVPAFAADFPLPPLPDDIDDYYYIVFEPEGHKEYRMWRVSKSDIALSDIEIKYADGFLYIYNRSNTKVNFNRYSGTSAGGWAFAETFAVPAVNGEITAYASDIVINYGNIDVYDKSGDLFFPLPPVPLAEEVMTLTGETMQAETIPAMVGSMNILVPCGVGLMALLVGLKLFGKRSLIFRS